MSVLTKTVRRGVTRIQRKVELSSLPNLEQSQWWDYERLLAFQERRLRQIVSYAYERIPGYRQRFKAAGICADDIRTLKDLRKIPITTRSDLQHDLSFVNAELINATLYTGGSTGTPLEYYESYLATNMRRRAHLRGWAWNGYSMGHRLAVITSAQGVVPGNNVLNLVGSMATTDLIHNVEQLQNFRPQYLRGYVSSLYLLARYVVDNDIKISGVLSVNPISENLYDYQREVMHAAFGCPVFEEYVCNDGGACAWECDAHAGLHYSMERAIIEEIDGEMIVTDLWNMAMPFIRYRNGDAVTFLPGKCACGRQLPLVKVKGRTNDIIISPTGLVSPSFLLHHGCGIATVDTDSRFVRGIMAVQYIQLPNYVLKVNVVKDNHCTDVELDDFRCRVAEECQGMTIQLNVVDELPATPKGKRSFVVNTDSDLLQMWHIQHDKPFSAPSADTNK